MLVCKLAAWAVACALVAAGRSASACAMAHPPSVGRAYVAHEDALIVWDAQKHVEHFVRTARFKAGAASFGFLVPTPARPTLAEAGDFLMDALEEVTAPEIEYRNEYEPVPIGCTMLPFALLSTRTGAPVSAGAPVRVLEETRVAGMDAAVLAADDAGALASWLSAHGFDFRDSLKRWVAPYLEKKWVITAFRYARPGAERADAAGSSLTSEAVRISFPADVPVYPYREPDDAPQTTGRELHLFVVADTAVDGAMGELGGAPWEVQRPFAAPVDRGACEDGDGVARCGVASTGMGDGTRGPCDPTPGQRRRVPAVEDRGRDAPSADRQIQARRGAAAL
jgi:hypothetical protein